jgi:steroid 5-alpha reductase family enzyme
MSAEKTDTSAPPSAARLLARDAPRDLGALLVLAAFIAEPSTRDFALVNLGVQLALFVFVACVPALRRGVMAFVDSAWSWGLIAIGVQALLFGDTGSNMLLVVAAIYLVMGGRMGIHSFYVAINAREDLPRYRYRRLLWEEEGFQSERVPMVHGILVQGLGNTSLLATPAMLAVADGDGGVGPLVVVGAVLWATAWVLESTADLQKARFNRSGESAGRTCEVGLWRYSRHPNYFCQWLQWTALVLVALPSLIRLADDFSTLPWIGFALGLVAIPGGMYFVLVRFTGAIPAEHFSVQHRPDYRDYQRRVNRFFPGPTRS